MSKEKLNGESCLEASALDPSGLIRGTDSPPVITICDGYSYDCLIGYWFGETEFQIPKDKKG